MIFKTAPLILFFHVLLFTACAHHAQNKERILSPTEMQKLGLTAMIFDVPVCPTKVDPKTGKSIVVGPCELITCEPEKDRLVCRAIKDPKNHAK